MTGVTKEIAGRAEWYDDVEVNKDAKVKPLNYLQAVETDPTGRPAHTPGSKLDAGKPPVFRGVLNYFGKAIRAVATVSLFGSTKYVWKGWESVPDGVERYADATGRHMTDTASVPVADEGLVGMLVQAFPGLTITPEIVHSAQAAWNALATLELRLRGATGPPSVINVSPAPLRGGDGRGPNAVAGRLDLVL